MKIDIYTPYRTGSIEAIEEPDRVIFVVELSRYGEFPDNAEVWEKLAEVILSYSNDPRPFVIRNPLTGEVATIQDLTNEVVVLDIEKRH